MPKPNKKTKKKKPIHKKIIAGLSIAALLAILFGSQAAMNPGGVIPQASPTPTIVASNPQAKCHINGVLPDSNCTPGGIRTPDHVVRTDVLYPTELQARLRILIGCSSWENRRFVPTISLIIFHDSYA